MVRFAVSVVLFLSITLQTTRADQPPSKSTVLPAAAAGNMDFRRDIWPILKANCIDCHKDGKARSGLRLDDGVAAMKGGNSGAVIKSRAPHKSRLLRLVAGFDPEVKMPPQGRNPLSAADIGRLRAWIEQGAPWPKVFNVAKTTAKHKDHWAFQPIRRRPIPQVKNASWVGNPIDVFVLARLEKENIAPSPAADHAALIRRLSLDLLGLPPSPEEVDDFLRESNAKPQAAYEKLVDRLLASPHYGERWGRHWLDLARYADSDGYEQDRPRPNAWRYRDWVIYAFNKNMPFDQFTIEQLAGDLLPNTTLEQKIATGFHRNTLTNNEGGTDKEQFRVEACVDRVNTTAQVWLGLTLGCAQCHDHKYDPFTQREYYQFFAFFNSDVESNVPIGDRKKKQFARTLALGKTRKTHVLIRGDFLRPGVEVNAGFPDVLKRGARFRSCREEGKIGILPHDSKPQAAKNRLDLARWLVNPKNPLPARVIVNWVWRHHFGRGLVATPEDFGTRGEKPSHPQLLDWLASEFVRGKWDIKRLHKIIVTSAAYRQVSRNRPELAERDPNNVLLYRQNRFRLSAETIRDNALAVSGLLTRRIGGPSVKPPQPKGVSELTYAGRAKWAADKGPNRFRRGMYTWFQRTSPYPMFMMFDGPDSTVCCVRRERSNTPLQALTLLNDTVFVECAQALGKRILIDNPNGSTSDRLRYVFRACFARELRADEKYVLEGLYENLLKTCRVNPKATAKLAGGVNIAGVDVVEIAAWTAQARTLLNLDEFVNRE